MTTRANKYKFREAAKHKINTQNSVVSIYQKYHITIYYRGKNRINA